MLPRKKREFLAEGGRDVQPDGFLTEARVKSTRYKGLFAGPSAIAHASIKQISGSYTIHQ